MDQTTENHDRTLNFRFRGPPPRIAINGLRLEEVEMRIIEESESDTSARFVTFPRNQHRILRDGEVLMMQIPALTALQLYFDGILSSERNRHVEIAVNEHKPESYRVTGLRQVPEDFRRKGLVMLRMVRVGGVR